VKGDLAIIWAPNLHSLSIKKKYEVILKIFGGKNCFILKVCRN
jgi:hypothetical protein